VENNYMVLGFTIFFAVIFLHIASFMLRSRSLQRDLRWLEQVDKKAPKKSALKQRKK
jgi:hypothetical protein